jgi:hypothetical protein
LPHALILRKQSRVHGCGHLFSFLERLSKELLVLGRALARVLLLAFHHPPLPGESGPGRFYIIL